MHKDFAATHSLKYQHLHCNTIVLQATICDSHRSLGSHRVINNTVCKLLLTTKNVYKTKNSVTQGIYLEEKQTTAGGLIRFLSTANGKAPCKP